MSVYNLIWLDDALDPINDADLYPADVDDGVKEVKRILDYQATPYFDVTLENPGWGFFAEKRAAAIVEHVDGTMATAEIVARGTRREMPSDLAGDFITLRFDCSPEQEDLENAQEEVAKEFFASVATGNAPSSEYRDGVAEFDPSATALPYRELLLGRGQYLRDDVKLTVPQFFACDPVTHDVTLRLQGAYDRVVNVGDSYRPDSLKKSPNATGTYSQIKAQLVVSLSVQAGGGCDIAGMLSPGDTLLGFKGQGERSIFQNVGWSLGAPVTRSSFVESRWLYTGQTFAYKQRQAFYVTDNLDNGATTTNTTYGATFARTTEVRVTARVENYNVVSWPCTYSYNQSRRENISITLDVPVQPGTTGPKAILDLGEIQVGNLYTIDGLDAQPYSDDATYEAGDYMILGGTVWKATAQVTGFWELVFQRRKWVPQRKAAWVQTTLSVPVTNTAALSYADTHRGTGTIASQLLRMGVQALNAMRDEYEITCNREDLPRMRLTDRVRFLLPGRWDEDMKIAVGDVLRVEETLGGDDETVVLTLGVSLGTGADESARPATINPFGGEDYFDDDYMEVGTAWYTAGDDIEWTMEADPLVSPVDPRMLASPFYSLRGILRSGNADTQAAQFEATGAQGLDPQNNPPTPTTVDLSLLPLVSSRLIERDYHVSARLLRSPRGIDLFGDGEP